MGNEEGVREGGGGVSVFANLGDPIFDIINNDLWSSDCEFKYMVPSVNRKTSVDSRLPPIFS